MATTVIIHFNVKPDQLASFRDIMAGVKQSLPATPGCTGLRIFNKEGEPHLFTLVEDWDSAASHKAHLERFVASGAWEQVASHLASDPVSGYFDAF